MASHSLTIFHCYVNRQRKNSELRLRRRIFSCQQSPDDRIGRREIILRSSELATIGAIFHFRFDTRNPNPSFPSNPNPNPNYKRNHQNSDGDVASGTKPNYLGVQKNPPSLALCPATRNCVSTSENRSDLTHYAPPWNYNPGSRTPVSREVAMQELLDVIKSTKPDNFTPRIIEHKDDYVRVEYECPILGFVDDVEFWFPPGKKPIVEYRSASRLGSFDFDINRKRIKALRQALEKKGWSSESSF